MVCLTYVCVHFECTKTHCVFSSTDENVRRKSSNSGGEKLKKVSFALDSSAFVKLFVWIQWHEKNWDSNGIQCCYYINNNNNYNNEFIQTKSIEFLFILVLENKMTISTTLYTLSPYWKEHSCILYCIHIYLTDY